jgi:hypothetical protein
MKDPRSPNKSGIRGGACSVPARPAAENCGEPGRSGKPTIRLTDPLRRPRQRHASPAAAAQDHAAGLRLAVYRPARREGRNVSGNAGGWRDDPGGPDCTLNLLGGSRRRVAVGSPF